MMGIVQAFRSMQQSVASFDNSNRTTAAHADQIQPGWR
jgi:hypothetical protein